MDNGLVRSFTATSDQMNFVFPEQIVKQPAPGRNQHQGSRNFPTTWLSFRASQMKGRREQIPFGNRLSVTSLKYQFRQGLKRKSALLQVTCLGRKEIFFFKFSKCFPISEQCNAMTSNDSEDMGRNICPISNN